MSTIFVGEILDISQPPSVPLDLVLCFFGAERREVCFDPEGFDLLRWYDPKNDVKCRNGEEPWRSWLL